MAEKQQSTGKIKITFKQAIGLLIPYVRSRIIDQIKSVATIIVYLLLFQTLVLRIPIIDALVIAAGLAVVIAGLAFFMEGLFLGIMPLGELIGVKLPQKSKLPVILIFAFILGVGVTFAEPAIGILKAAGFSVKPWDAPLLFLLLNKYSYLLVWTVGAGVGLAVVGGTLRFLYSWSLKPYLYISVAILTGLSIWAVFDPNVIYLTGVAWDCGGVTTGPVTVPCVLALGIGICRIVGTAGSGASGFGVVTLASIFPVFTVMCLAFPFLSKVPQPMSETDFLSVANRAKAEYVFVNSDDMAGYALRNASMQGQLAYFNNDTNAMRQFIADCQKDVKKRVQVFGAATDAMQRWAVARGNEAQRLWIFGSGEATRQAMSLFSDQNAPPLDFIDVIKRNNLASLQAIFPLMLFLFLVLTVVLREKLPRADEIALGIIFALVGMGLFNIGIELGLAKLGSQVGNRVPSSFKAIDMPEQRTTIANFDTSIVQSAITPTGEKQRFFYTKTNDTYKTIPYHEKNYDQSVGQYTFIPAIGPLFGSVGGIMVILLFGFLLGYGATLAEPALNALGRAVEELTVGSFKKSVLMQTVATGVGIGIAFGIAKIIWDIPLIWLLTPPYLLLMPITFFSTEEFVNIGWDSAGVTTGPITVPLVLAMGLGISAQMGVVEGFGILALASVWPILTVLTMGLFVTHRRKALLRDSAQAKQKGAAA